MDDDRQIVIVGVGECLDRPAVIDAALEPVELMAAATRNAALDSGADIAPLIDSISIVNQISWPYPDPCGLLSKRLTISPSVAEYGVVGGQTPLEFLVRAATRLLQGETRIELLCGAEAEYSVRQARGALPHWSPRIENFTPVRGAAYQREIPRRLDAATPAHVYPFYENATLHRWGQTPTDAMQDSVDLWRTYSAIAATNSTAWYQRPYGAEEIGTISTINRMIAWPYPKLMTANPMVNQGAAILLTTANIARRLGVDDSKFVYLWGASRAEEPRDYLLRANYYESRAMDSVLSDASRLVERNGSRFAAQELYSCFPCVPKMARRLLRDALPPTVTGGLTFFGAPLNNYMTHATAAMARRLRETNGAGLLYGQGEYVTKHCSVVLGRVPALFEGLPEANLVKSAPPTNRTVLDSHVGKARLETFTVLFDRDGEVRHGVAICLTPDDARFIARVPSTDYPTIATFLSRTQSPIGIIGDSIVAHDGISEWQAR